MTDAAVKINGKPAGPIHQGAFLPVQIRRKQAFKDWQRERTGGFRKKTFR